MGETEYARGALDYRFSDAFARGLFHLAAGWFYRIASAVEAKNATALAERVEFSLLRRSLTQQVIGVIGGTCA